MLISAQDVKAGTSTGVSAKDRCLTVRALASSDSRPSHFRRPGHIFPLRYREGGKVFRIFTLRIECTCSLASAEILFED